MGDFVLLRQTVPLFRLLLPRLIDPDQSSGPLRGDLLAELDLRCLGLLEPAQQPPDPFEAVLGVGDDHPSVGHLDLRSCGCFAVSAASAVQREAPNELLQAPGIVGPAAQQATHIIAVGQESGGTRFLEFSHMLDDLTCWPGCGVYRGGRRGRRGRRGDRDR